MHIKSLSLLLSDSDHTVIVKSYTKASLISCENPRCKGCALFLTHGSISSYYRKLFLCNNHTLSFCVHLQFLYRLRLKLYSTPFSCLLHFLVFALPVSSLFCSWQLFTSGCAHTDWGALECTPTFLTCQTLSLRSSWRETAIWMHRPEKAMVTSERSGIGLQAGCTVRPGKGESPSGGLVQA